MGAIVIEEDVRIPEWVRDLESFRRWVRSDDFPSHGWFSHLQGELWVDLSMERVKHNKVKGMVTSVLTLLVREGGLGHFFHDRMRLTHVGAELSTEPDGMFIGHDALEGGKVRLEEGEDAVEVLGTPDMVLEVISPKSVRKDTVILRKLYWEAGVSEYWLVDSRPEVATLEVLRYTRRGYTAARSQGGWLPSAVFGKSVRLTQEKGRQGYSEFTLAVR